MTANVATEPPPVLGVFLDGLGADAVDDMPFLRAQATVRRMRTELGYSVTCHASMYTGLRPDRHGLWFVWQRRPQSSPFRWLRPLRFLNRVDNLALHVLATKVTRRFARTASWFGIPYPVHARWRDIPDLDVSERKLWPEPGYLNVPTIFDAMRSANVRFEIVGMNRRPPRGLESWRAWEPQGDPAPFTYLFAGDVDHTSHAHGQRSAEVRELVREVDGLIEQRYRALADRVSELRLMVWSDHGHHDVQTVNPLPLLRERGVGLHHPYVIDSNFIRMWVDDATERTRVRDALDGLGIGHVLSDDELRRHRVKMDDDRYGNVIFYVDLPWALTHTIWGFGRRLASAHGYLPEYPRSDALFVSNVPARDGDLHLVDVAPSLLALLGIPADPGLDGAIAWASGLK